MPVPAKPVRWQHRRDAEATSDVMLYFCSRAIVVYFDVCVQDIIWMSMDV